MVSVIKMVVIDLTPSVCWDWRRWGGGGGWRVLSRPSTSWLPALPAGHHSPLPTTRLSLAQSVRTSCRATTSLLPLLPLLPPPSDMEMGLSCQCGEQCQSDIINYALTHTVVAVTLCLASSSEGITLRFMLGAFLHKYQRSVRPWQPVWSEVLCGVCSWSTWNII